MIQVTKGNLINSETQTEKVTGLIVGDMTTCKM